VDLLFKLSKASAYRDKNTFMHVIRTGFLCRLIGLTCGMSDTDVDLLLNVSPMHDVGKASIPDDLLCKPGKLNNKEWEVMKAHTTIGAQIIGDHRYEPLKTAKLVALTHHERWDGNGYPKGLHGEQIPLMGRIVAICDVFDALTSERPYKRAWSKEEAIEVIIRGSGSHFDPLLVNAFVEVIPEIYRKKIEYTKG
jgi:putative two-component system response regulator